MREEEAGTEASWSFRSWWRTPTTRCRPQTTPCWRACDFRGLGPALKDQPGAGVLVAPDGRVAKRTAARSHRSPRRILTVCCVRKLEIAGGPTPKRVASAAGGASAFQGAALARDGRAGIMVHTQSGDGLSQQDSTRAHKVVVVAPSDGYVKTTRLI